MSMNGKVAIVTGSATGIGQAIAHALAEQGAKMILTGLDEEAGTRTLSSIVGRGGEARWITADLLDESTPHILVEAAISAWGKLDYVINNAALICNKPIPDITHDDWDDLFGINLKAPFFLVQRALPWLRHSRGAIVNIGSTSSLHNLPGNIVYDTMKAGLSHMTRGLALDLRESGIRVNAVLPGGTATPTLERWLLQTTGTDRDAPGEATQRIAELMRAPNIAAPEQIADAVMLLLSDRSSWIHGAIVPVDGGYDL